MKRTVNFFKNLFVKNDVAPDTRSDYDRSLFDLACDVRQKRKLIDMLFRKNKRQRLAFKFIGSFLIVGFAMFLIFSQDISERKTFNTNYNIFKNKYISSLGLIATNPSDFTDIANFVEDNSVVIESKMLTGILAMEKKKYGRAVAIFDQLNTDEAKWLQALCLFRMKKKRQAKKVLDELIKSNSLFYMEAQEIIEKYYNNN
jgi:hypothetical protein